MSRHLHFIDWLKAIGMLLILLGHVFGSPDILYNQISAPIYTKQLGVAFFVFITGWSLANDTRTPIRIAFNRLFPVYFFGVGFALLISIMALVNQTDPNESNYLPFIFGLSVFQNHFPANPTTWYFGMYFHLILFWYLVISHRTINLKHVAIGAAMEISLRALLVEQEVTFIAYMGLHNWLTPFLLGAYLRNKEDCAWTSQSTLITITWSVILLTWGYCQSHLSLEGSFPFMAFPVGPSNFTLLNTTACSILITFIYAANTLIAFDLTRRLPLPKLVAFLARNTLITVIVHMPLIYAYAGQFYGLIEDPILKRLAFVAILFVGISLFSEVVNRLLPVKKINNATWALCGRPLLWLDGFIAKRAPDSHMNTR